MLRLTDVSKSYGRGPHRVEVLRGVTLHVNAGETVWLRGSSGSGKSSLVRIAGLLSTPDTGNVTVGGTTHVRNGRAADVRRQLIGMVFQHSNLLPDLSVVENVMLAKKEIRRTEVLARLEVWGLAEIADRSAKSISGGEAQRVAFCRALVNEPQLLLVDEPTSGLDDANSQLVRQQVNAARAEGRAILVASHDSNMGAIADRTLVIERGALNEEKDV